LVIAISVSRRSLKYFHRKKLGPFNKSGGSWPLFFYNLDID